MASLQSLPEHLVGHIFSLLPDSASKKAFFSCSIIVHDADSVLNQISKCVLPTEMLREHFQASSRDQAPPTTCRTPRFPRAAQLKELVFKRIKPWSRDGEDGGFPDDSSLIRQTLRSWDQDEAMCAKLQQVTHVKLFNCCFGSDKEAALLGDFLRSLPCLQALTISKLGGPKFPLSNQAALIHSLSSATPQLKELHCDLFDACNFQAVSCLSSLESLSLECLEDTKSNELSLLSSLTALRHLSIKALRSCHQHGLTLALPHLKHLSSLKLGWLASTSQLATMPKSLRCVDVMGSTHPKELCSYLEAIVRGACLPSLHQLRIKSLCFNKASPAVLKMRGADPACYCYLDSLPALRELGHSVGSLLAMASSLVLTIGRVWIPPRISSFIAFMEPLRQPAQGLSSIVIERVFGDTSADKVASADLARLAQLCPNIKELCHDGNVHFENLETSLHEVLSGFPQLLHFAFRVGIKEEPNYEDICIEFCEALALDHTRCRDVSKIEVVVVLKASSAWGDNDEVPPGMEDIMDSNDLWLEALDLMQEWAEVSASLRGKVREVKLLINTSSYYPHLFEEYWT